MDRQYVEDLWYRRQPIPGAAFRLNDAVAVVGGMYEGNGGAVLSLEALEPTPAYLVEFGDRRSAVLPESVLSAAV